MQNDNPKSDIEALSAKSSKISNHEEHKVADGNQNEIGTKTVNNFD